MLLEPLLSLICECTLVPPKILTGFSTSFTAGFSIFASTITTIISPLSEDYISASSVLVLYSEVEHFPTIAPFPPVRTGLHWVSPWIDVRGEGGFPLSSTNLHSLFKYVCL